MERNNITVPDCVVEQVIREGSLEYMPRAMDASQIIKTRDTKLSSYFKSGKSMNKAIKDWHKVPIRGPGRRLES